MTDIHIVRTHQLGLAGARRIAQQWAHDAQHDYGMQCSLADDGDTIDFQQAGVKGTLSVTAERFELSAELGFLFKGFRQQIASGIESRLDSLLSVPPAAS